MVWILWGGLQVHRITHALHTLVWRVCERIRGPIQCFSGARDDMRLQALDALPRSNFQLGHYRGTNATMISTPLEADVHEVIRSAFVTEKYERQVSSQGVVVLHGMIPRV